MNYDTDVPEEIYNHLLPFLYAMRKITRVDVKQKAVADMLERESLREWRGDRRHLSIPALKWALAHPEKEYRALLVRHKIGPFTNEDCLKLFALFLRSLEHLDDEGPDIVEPVAPYLETPGDMDDWLAETKSRQDGMKK